MRLYGLLQLVTALLRYKGRLTYAALQHEFGLDDATLDAIRHELIFAERVATDEAGRVLVWAGEESAPHVAVPLTTRTPVSMLPTLPPLVTSPTTVTQKPTIYEPEAPAARQEDTEPLAAAAPTGPEAMAEVTAVAAAPTRPAPEAERRQLTVMFCDLVGSTTLSGQLDPEDLREVVRAYQETAAGVIQRYDGHIAQYLGDGLLVYFGYPLAHEDDALRAVYTGLDIIDAMATLNTRLEADYGVQLAVRLGLHTGPVVVGQMGGGGRHEQLALGETPNIAARLEGLAAPNTVVVSPVTARLVADMCILESLGPQTLKGMDQPLELWCIRGPRDLGSIEDATADERAVLLVGRDEELGLLRRRWEQSKEGLGQVVLITGEAGIGKSSLVQVLRAQAAQEGLPRITFRCSPYHTNSVLYPTITHLHRLLRFEREDPPDVKLAKLERGLQPYALLMEEVVPLLAALLAVPLPEGCYPALPLSSQQHRLQTLDALNAWLLAEAERQPLLILWEDLHWADPTTLELLGGLVDQTPTAALLNVLTFRPEFVPPWPPRSHMTPLTLNRLERPQVEALITRLAKGKRLPPEVVAYIVTHADGVPLYVEELTKALLESALLEEEMEHYRLTGPLTSVAIPATLQDSLMARLDRLPTVREVAQIGAVLGREFAYEMLRALAIVEEDRLQDGLAQLVEAELLYQRGRPPRAKYIFKHALVQDAAYQSILRRTRQHYHQQVAQLMETRFADLVQTEPELVAHHYTEAGAADRAIPYWQRAGQQALQRSANLEAVQHLTTALKLLASLPETPARAQHELDLQIALGPAWMATKGIAAPEVEQTYARARALCEQIGDTPQLFPTLRGLCRFYLGRGALPTARELGEQLVRLAMQATDPTHRLEAHDALGTTLFFRGDYVAARTHLEQIGALTDPVAQWDLVRRQVELHGPRYLAEVANTLWCLGYPAQAARQSQEALALVQALAHPYSRAAVQSWVAHLHYRRREVQAVQALADALLTLATAQGFPFHVGYGTCWRGWTLVMQGQSEVGLAQLRQGLAAVVATGQELMRPFCLVVLAEAAGQVGQVEKGLQLLAEAVGALEANEQGDPLAEAHRLQGKLFLRQATPDAAQAEACFQQALAIARRQQAKSWELRAGVSLSCLWQQQGKQAEAHELLAPIYEWFTEGFDTADLQEAKALLEDLAT